MKPRRIKFPLAAPIVTILVLNFYFLQSFAQEKLEYFDAIGTSPEQAEIFVIGENHGSSTDSEMELWLIRTYGGKSDILLLEGASGKPGFAQPLEKHLKEVVASQSLSVGGWDDRDAFETVIKVLREVLSNYETYSSNESSYWDKTKSWVSAVKNVIRFSDLNRIRNTSLREKALSVSQEFSQNKIFLIAGSSHVLDEISLLVETLKLTGRPFLVLLPKEDNPQRKLEKEGLEYLRELLK